MEMVSGNRGNMFRMMRSVLGVHRDVKRMGEGEQHVDMPLIC